MFSTSDKINNLSLSYPLYNRDDPRSKIAPGKLKFTVRLADDKVKERDLYFTPDQSFDDEMSAQHACALLALFHFEPTRPHERKLPEPYRTMWLSLSGAPVSSKDSEKSEKSEEFKCEKCGKSYKKEFALETHIKREHPIDKNAVLIAGSPEEVGVSSKMTVENSTTSKKEEEGFDLFSKIKDEEETKLNNSKEPIVLSSVKKFASVAEKRLADEEHNKERLAKQKRREMLELANKPITVIMSEQNRILIEGKYIIKYICPIVCCIYFVILNSYFIYRSYTFLF